MGAASRRPPRLRFAAALPALIAGWLLAETGAWVGLSIVDRAPLTPGRVAVRLERPATGDDLVAAALAEPGTGAERPWQSVHPYVGYVVDPAAGWPGVGSYGLPAAATTATPETVRVALFGGSLAMAVWSEHRAALARPLEQALGRPVAVENFALSAYKQPQQLMLLAFALVRGERFDVVVNLDGFNEAALPYDGLPAGLDPLYPFQWNERAAPIHGPEALRALAGAMDAGDRRRRLGRVVATGPWRYSPLGHLAWRVADGMVARREAAWRRRWEEAAASARSFRTHGAEPPASEEALFVLEVEVWERASRQMHALVESADGRYYHFLQPNQYDEGSKPLGAEERALAVGPAGPGTGGWAVRHVYPRFSEAGRRLRADGIRFRDLRRIFADRPEPLWADDCCHPNAEGLRLIARRIGQAVARDLAAQEQAPGPALSSRTK